MSDGNSAANIAKWELKLAADISDGAEPERCEALVGLAREIVHHFHFDIRPGHEIDDDEFVWAVRAADALAECLAMEGQIPGDAPLDPAILAEAHTLSRRLQNYGDVVPGENLTPRRRSRLRARGAVRKPLADVSFTPDLVESVQNLESKLYGSQAAITTRTAEIFATPPAPALPLEAEDQPPPAIRILVPPPSIRLTVTPDTIVAGDSVTIAWDGDNIDHMEVWADGERIHSGADPVGRTDHSPTDGTSIVAVELRAWNSAQQALLTPVTASVEVRLPSPPVIDSFDFSPANPVPGDEVKIWWNCRHADQVLLQNDDRVDSVEAAEAKSVLVDSTSVWTLTATSKAGRATKSITIAVPEPEPLIDDIFTSRPIIHEFRADPEIVEEGSSVTLYWDIVNAVERTLYAPEPKSISDKGSLWIESPAKGVVYRLVAAVPRANLSVSKELTLQFRAPVFTDFDESDEPAPPRREDPPPGISPFQFGAEEPVWPTGANPGGFFGSSGTPPPPPYKFGQHSEEEPYEQPASRTLTPPPKVDFFVSPEVIRAGDKVTLSWSAQWTDRIAILDGRNTLHQSADLTGEIDHYPAIDTDYELQAWNSEDATLPSPLSRSVRISNEPAVSIDSFTATPSHLLGGGEVVIKWNCLNATKVTLASDTNEKIVPSSGEDRVSIQSARKWKLSAEGVGPVQTRELEVRVDPLPPAPEPRISFYATPASIRPGGIVRLQWEVLDATEIRIEPLVGSVSRHGSRDVAPHQTTTFHLYARNSSHAVERTALVEVASKPPGILSFDISRRTVPPGTKVKLSWATRGVTEVLLEPGGGRCHPTGHIFVIPQTSTTYTLTAGAGPAQRIATRSVRVSRIPPGAYFLLVLLLLAIALPLTFCGSSTTAPPSANTTVPVVAPAPDPRVVEPEPRPVPPPAVEGTIAANAPLPAPATPDPQRAAATPPQSGRNTSIPSVEPARIASPPADPIIAPTDQSPRLSDLQREIESSRKELTLAREQLNSSNASRSALDAQSTAELTRLREEAAAKTEIAANLQRQLERTQRIVPSDPPARRKAVSGSFVWVYEGENRPMFDVAVRFPGQSPDSNAIVNVGVIRGDPLPGVPCRVVPDNRKVTTVEPVDTTVDMRGFRFRVPGKDVFKKGQAVVRFYWTRLDLLRDTDALPKGNMP